MTRRAAKVTHSEVTRLVKAVQACGLPIARVTFDGERVDVVTTTEETPSAPTTKPDTFQSWEEYEAWRDANRRA